MWHTPRGDRVLAGKERTLFVHAAAYLLDDLLNESQDPDRAPESICPTGVPLFDRLDVTAWIALLRDLVQALTDLAVPMPELTAANEAAAYAVFRVAQDEIEREVELEHDLAGREVAVAGRPQGAASDLFRWRKLVVGAYRETLEPGAAGSGPEAEIDANSDDSEEWWSRVEALANRIVWDRDWELEDLIVDDPPERSHRVKVEMRISRDYFVAMPRLLTERQVREATTFVRRVAAGGRDDQDFPTGNLN